MLYPFVARWIYGWFSARRMPLFGDQGLPPAGDPYVALVSMTSDRLVSFGVPFDVLVHLLSLDAGPPDTEISCKGRDCRAVAGLVSFISLLHGLSEMLFEELAGPPFSLVAEHD
jgi:hypothetical protein